MEIYSNDIIQAFLDQLYRYIYFRRIRRRPIVKNIHKIMEIVESDPHVSALSTIRCLA